MEHGLVAVGQRSHRGGWSQDRHDALGRTGPGWPPAGEVEGLELARANQQGRTIAGDDHGADRELGNIGRPELTVGPTVQTSSWSQPFGPQSPVQVLGRRRAATAGPAYGFLVRLIVLAPAQPTGAVAGSQGHRLVEKEQRGPVPGTIERRAPALILGQTHDPQRTLVVADQAGVVVHQAASIAGEQAPRRHRVKIAPGVDPIPSGHSRRLLNPGLQIGIGSDLDRYQHAVAAVFGPACKPLGASSTAVSYSGSMASETMVLGSQRFTLDDASDAQELFHSRGWTDGLPVVPPTATAVQAALDWVGLPPGHLLGIEPVRQRAITAEKVAINAVMAGCLPMHLPVVLAAMTAVLDERFEVHGPTASTGGSAILVIVNGPIRRELGMEGTFNALGQSDRATSCIGRAVRLALLNLLDVRPGGIDRSTFGHPGKFSYCVAEDEEGSAWPSLAAERLGDPHVSAVTVMAALSPRQIMNEWTTEPTEILDTFVAEIKANMLHYSIWAGNYAILVPPQLREHFHRAGWSKADIRQYVFDRARIYRREWADVGKGSVVADRGDWEYQALASPDHLLVIAAGGPAGGFGIVIPPWLGTKSRAVTVPIGACIDC